METIKCPHCDKDVPLPPKIGHVLHTTNIRWNIENPPAWRFFPSPPKNLPQTFKVFAGLFWYRGFGMGEYFSSDGGVYWVGATRAHAMAEDEKVSFHWEDEEKYKIE